jgi:hypothetical protein
MAELNRSPFHGNSIPVEQRNSCGTESIPVEQRNSRGTESIPVYVIVQVLERFVECSFEGGF